jgi:transcriptional regulator with XRE-family HTH domain
MEVAMVKVQDAFGKRLREIRRRRDMTQERLAELSGLSIQYIGEIERGKRNPSLTSIETLASALDMSVADLFDLETFQVTNDEMKTKLIDQINRADDEQLRILYAISRAILG